MARMRHLKKAKNIGSGYGDASDLGSSSDQPVGVVGLWRRQEFPGGAQCRAGSPGAGAAGECEGAGGFAAGGCRRCVGASACGVSGHGSVCRFRCVGHPQRQHHRHPRCGAVDRHQRQWRCAAQPQPIRHPGDFARGENPDPSIVSPLGGGCVGPNQFRCGSSRHQPP